MTKLLLMEIRELADFNPAEKLHKGTLAKKIPMGSLQTFTKAISGFELSEYKSGPKFRNGDTLLAKITPCLENGKTAYVDILEDGEIAFGSSEFIVLRAKPDGDSNYLYYLARSPAFRKKAIGCMEGTSGRKRVNEQELKLHSLPMPEKDGQIKIGRVLAVIDRKIELNNRVNAQLEAVAKTLYDYWFVQFDFPDENGRPYKTAGGKMRHEPILNRSIPDVWEVGTLWDIARYYNGPAMQKYRAAEGEEYLPVVKIREMNNGIGPDTEKARVDIPSNARVIDGDILFSWSASLAVQLWTGGEGALNQHIFKVTSEDYPKSFYYFELLAYLQYFRKVAELRKTTMGHITLGHLKQAHIRLPPKHLVEELDRRLSPMFEQLVMQKQQNRQLEQLRDWLLPMLMNGQVTVS